MTRTLYTRNSTFMRVVSAVVALSFTLSLAGFGYASTPDAPVPDEPVVVEGVTQPEPEAPAVPEAPSQDPGTDPSVEAEPTTTEPLVTGTQDEGSGGSSKKDAAPEVAAVAPAVVEPALVGDPADINIVEFNGYRSDQSKWTSGNLGSDYQEGDWVPYRLVLVNTGDAPVDVTDIIVGIDHYDGNPNPAVMFDETRMWGYAISASAPLTGDGPGAPAGFTALNPDYQDQPDGSWGSAPTIATKIGAGAFLIPPGEYATVYFQGHLALTAYWQLIQPGTDGAGGFPGSSGHGYLEMAAGARTLPLPSVTVPGGDVTVYKFNDTNQNGVKDAGETEMLSGWTIHLASEQYGIDIPKVTDADGKVVFESLPDGTYTVTEEMEDGWDSLFTSEDVVVTSGGSEVVYVGNFRPDVTKTWSLSIDALPAGAEPWVEFRVDGGDLQTEMLTGSGPYTATTEVAWGSTISDISWYVTWGGEDILLGTSPDETLEADKTNEFTYDSSVEGMKYDYASDDGLPGWEIGLYRIVDDVEVLYGSTFTGAGGAYSFEDVLPGTYVVHEVLQSGWLMMVEPAGSFDVGNDVHVTGLDFGNLFIDSDIEVVKTGPALAHVGDVITYEITVTNTGNYTLTNVLVFDPTVGLDETIPMLGAGESQTFFVDYEIMADDPDPLPNTVTATGTDGLGGTVSDTDDHLVDILKPEITVVKTASPTQAVNPANVTYTYEVTNSGEDTLTDVVLTDDILGDIPLPKTTLAPGETISVDVDAELTVSTTNVADVVGYDALGLMVTDDDPAHVDIYNPSISIVKSADPVVGLPGDLFEYTYLVTNTGDITLTDVTVEDNILGPIGFVASLAPDAMVTFTVTVPVDVDTTNIGSVIGYYGEEETEFFGSVTDTSEAYVEIVNPGISIDKTASPTNIISGDSVTYYFEVTNTGDVALYNVSVVDDKLGPIGVIAVLLPGASETLEMSTTLTEDTVNVATATGTDEYDHEVTDDDDAEVLVWSPAIEIVKTADPTIILAGETVTYTYEVTNIGDIDLFDVEVEDDMLGVIGTIPSLAVGESQTLTMDAAIDVDTDNVGTATGYYGNVESDFFGSVTDDDDASVDVIAPAVEIVKTADPSAVIAGGEVTYTFVVTNTGDVPLFDLTVTDDKLGLIDTIATLDVGESVTLTATTTLDVTTTNVATVVGYDELEHEVTDSDDATVPVYNPSISIVKTVSADTVLSGETVTYTYLVTNTGDIALSGVSVDDDILGFIGGVPLLEPGQSTTLTKDAIILADVTNVGTAVGYYGEIESDFYGSVTDDDDAAVDVIAPLIDVTKVADQEIVDPGGSVTYTYVVTNIGDVDLFNVTLTDDKLGVVGTLESLVMGEEQTFTSTTTLSTDTTNTVVAVGYDRLEHEVTDEATEFVAVNAPFQDWAFDKSADKTEAKEGDIVTYTLTYRVIGGNAPFTDPIPMEDDFDERYVTPVDVGDGEVVDGKIFYTDPNEGGMKDGDVRTYTYTVRIKSDLPVGTTMVDNVAVLKVSPPIEDSWSVKVVVGEPFLPFTGIELSLFALLMAIAIAAGVLLRTWGRIPTN